MPGVVTKPEGVPILTPRVMGWSTAGSYVMIGPNKRFKFGLLGMRDELMISLVLRYHDFHSALCRRQPWKIFR